MNKIMFTKEHVTPEDWQRLKVLQVKSLFRAIGLEKYYGTLMRDCFPKEYEKRSDRQRLHDVWNLRTYDKQIVDRLNACVENIKNV